jgi:hypothetical protein
LKQKIKKTSLISGRPIVDEDNMVCGSSKYKTSPLLSSLKRLWKKVKKIRKLIASNLIKIILQLF